MRSSADLSLDGIKKAHFIGIGGIGMSGIARLMLKSGFAVSGSDLKESELTKELRAEGARVFIGHHAANVRSADLVVVSSAVKGGNPELSAALRGRVKTAPRALVLARLAASKKTITVSGSHGKTSTTSMLAAALEGAGADATVVVGGVCRNIASNSRWGGGEYLVAEADESDGSFLYFDPLVTCVTNIDTDHLDHYGSMENLKRAFLEHLAKVPFYGAAVVCADDPGAASILGATRAPLIRYGLKAGSDWTAAGLRSGPEGASYTAYFKGRRMGRVSLASGGRHNALNSLAALAAGVYLGFPFKALVRGLAGFKGVKRRMEKKGEYGGVTVLDDYGHHPTEIKATLSTVRAMYGGRLIVLFQPHRYSRTSLLRKEFPSAFDAADRAYVMDIYAAGERPLPGVSSELLLRGMRRRGISAERYPGALEIVKDLRAGDVLITVGAGDVWKTGEDILFKLQTVR